MMLPLEVVTAAAERIWQKVDRRGIDECWPWIASCDTYGYGVVGIASHLWKAHRAIFLLMTGTLPPVVMHQCDNPPCCNPRHLHAGTKALNNNDKMKKGRFVPCVGERNGLHRNPQRASRGDAHYARTRPELLARGERHGQAKVTAAQVNEMRRLFTGGGHTKRSIARRYGIGPSQIGRILNGEGWH